MVGSSEIGLVSRSQYSPGSRAERLVATGQAVRAAFSPASPLFLYFLFSVACATLRWRWRGTSWTTVVAEAASAGMGVYAAMALRDPEFQLNSSLAGTCSRRWWRGLVGRLDACQKRFRSETPKDSGQAPILMTPPVSYVIRVGILFAIYFATAKLGLMIDAVGGFATLVWPPTGISLAALLFFGLRLWPGIALG